VSCSHIADDERAMEAARIERFNRQRAKLMYRSRPKTVPVKRTAGADPGFCCWPDMHHVGDRGCAGCETFGLASSAEHERQRDAALLGEALVALL